MNTPKVLKEKEKSDNCFNVSKQLGVKSSSLRKSERFSFSEQKPMVDEHSFMNNLEFTSNFDHYQKFIKNAGHDQTLRPFVSEMSALLRKFQKMFLDQQKILAKLKEMNIYQDIISKQNDYLKNCIKEKDEIIENLEKKPTKINNQKIEKKLENEIKVTLEMEPKTNLESGKIKHGIKGLDVDSNEDNSTILFQKQQIIKLREQIVSQEEEFDIKISQLTRRLQQKSSTLFNLEQRLTEANKILKTINYELFESKNLYLEEVKKHEELNQQLSYIELNLESKEKEIRKLNIAFQSKNNECEDKTKTINEVKTSNTELTERLENLNQWYEKIKESLKLTENKLSLMTLDRDKFRTELEHCKSELKEKKDIILTLNGKCRKNDETIEILEEKKLNQAKKNNLLQVEISNLRRNFEENEKELYFQNDLIKKMLNEKCSAEKNFRFAKNEVVSFQSEMKIKESHIKVLSNEIKALQSEFDKEVQTNKDLTSNRNKVVQMSEQFEQQIRNLNDEVLCHKNYIIKLKKQVKSCEQKYTLEQNLLTETKDKYLICQKSLDDARNRNIKLQSDFLKLEDSIEQLSKKLRECHSEFSKVEEMNLKLNNEIMVLKSTLENTKIALENTKKKNVENDILIQSLKKCITNSEKTVNAITKTLNNVTRKNKTISAFIIKKTEEINLLKQKNSILNNILIRGKKEYNIKLENAKLLKSEIKNLTRQKKLYERKSHNVALLKRELELVRQKVNNEKLKVKTIEGVNTKNFHRWRFLEGKDPEKYQLLIKNQVLQTRFIKNASQLTEAQVELDKSKKQNEKLEDEVKKYQSYAQIIKNMVMYKNKYQQAKNLCDSLTSQVNMFTLQFTKFKQENITLKEELSKLKTNMYLKKLSNRLRISKS